MSSYSTDRNVILNSKAGSYWLKGAVVALENRDVLDALADAQMLLGLAKKRAEEALGRKVA